MLTTGEAPIRRRRKEGRVIARVTRRMLLLMLACIAFTPAEGKCPAKSNSLGRSFAHVSADCICEPLCVCRGYGRLPGLECPPGVEPSVNREEPNRPGYFPHCPRSLER